jgi:hypothetical protein
MKKFAILIVLIIFCPPIGYTQPHDLLFTIEKDKNNLWSVYVKFYGPSSKNLSYSKHGIKIRNYQKLNNKLYLQIYSQGHAKAKSGVLGYSFGLSEDSEGKQIIQAKNIPRHGISPDGVFAFHFRNIDNTGLNQIGPKNVNAPGATRLIKYEKYTMIIRVLEAEIINLGKNNIPTFSKINFLITVVTDA